jgi:rod shape-determining protein MreC
MEHQPPQFFKRGPSALARLSFFGLLSILLMVLDARFHYANGIRNTLALVIYPLQQVATAPITAFNHISEFFSSQSSLRQENALLRSEQLRNAEALLRLDALQAENGQLRELLQARDQHRGTAVFAEIIYAGRDPFSRKIIIDKGEQEGIEAGQPVIDVHGVLGQVTRVLPLLAEVTLITDKGHSIPVQVVRNGLRGVAYGSGDGSTLELRFMPANAEIQTGDVLVTSGLDNV